MRQSTRLVRGNRPPIALACLLIAAVAATGGILPGAASAGCGGVRTSYPNHKRNKGRPPLAIGDSVMLLALRQLAREGFEANAHGCRGFDEGLRLLRFKRHVGRLPHLVVIALGADFAISRRQIRAALHIIGMNRVLGLVTPRELGGGSGSDARNVRAAGRVYRKHVIVLDWVRASRGHGGWFQPDG